jgi:hypothetical protein
MDEFRTKFDFLGRNSKHCLISDFLAEVLGHVDGGELRRSWMAKEGMVRTRRGWGRSLNREGALRTTGASVTVPAIHAVTTAVMILPARAPSVGSSLSNAWALSGEGLERERSRGSERRGLGRRALL